MKRWDHGCHGARASASSSTPPRRRSMSAPPWRPRLRAAGYTELAEADQWPTRRQVLHRAGRLAGGLEQRRRRRRSTVPDRRRPHRQPQPAGQAASRPGRRRLAGGRAGALRRCLAELVAGPRPGHQRAAVGARRQPASRTDWSASTTRSCGCRSWPSTWPRTASRSTLDPQRHVNAVWGVGGAAAIVHRLRRRAGRRRPRRRAGRRPDDPRPDAVDG